MAHDLDFAYSDPGSLTPVQAISGGLWLKRDDLYRAAGAPGGKARTCWALAQGAAGLVAASHRHSPQMSMVGRAGAVLRIPVRIHTTSGPETSEMRDAARYGDIEFIRHSPGYNNVIIARARQDAKALGWTEIPFGMQSPVAVSLTAEQAANVPPDVKRIVVSVGCGISLCGILFGLRGTNRQIPVLGVMVGMPKPETVIDKWAPGDWRERATLVRAPERYEDHVSAALDGVVLDPIYEAKVVRYLEPGDMLWIVGIRASAL